MTARLPLASTDLKNGYLSGFQVTRQENNVGCQGLGMDHTEFCLPADQMLPLKRCTFQKMARSRFINLKYASAHQGFQPVTIGMERTRKDQASQGGSRSYWLPVPLLTPNSHEKKSHTLTVLTWLSPESSPEAPQIPRRYPSRKHLPPSRFLMWSQDEIFWKERVM